MRFLQTLNDREISTEQYKEPTTTTTEDPNVDEGMYREPADDSSVGMASIFFSSYYVAVVAVAHGISGKKNKRIKKSKKRMKDI
eukprot:UN26036